MTEWFERIAHSFQLPQRGRVVYFNGTSSSGKTTIAKKLRSKLLEEETLYLYLGVDEFYAMLTDTSSTTELFSNIDLEAELPKILFSFNQVIPQITEGGNNLIVDNVFHSSFWGKLAVEPIQNEDVLFVGVFCSDHVNDAREKERGDRTPGLAAFQRKETHTHCVYDITIDTSTETVEDSVEKILSTIHLRDEPFTGIAQTWQNMRA